jgi:hypothetical protein
MAYLGRANRREIWAGSGITWRESTRESSIGGIRWDNTLAAIADTRVSRGIDDGNTLEAELHVLLALSVLVGERESIFAETVRYRDDISRLVSSAHLWLVPCTVGNKGFIWRVGRGIGVPESVSRRTKRQAFYEETR